MSLDEQHWLKLSRAWGRYRTVVDFANQSRDEAVHQALFNIFCREFTYRLEMAFSSFLTLRTQVMNDYHWRIFIHF